MSLAYEPQPLVLDDIAITAEVDALIASIPPVREPRYIPNYEGLKYTAAWWAKHNAAR